MPTPDPRPTANPRPIQQRAYRVLVADDDADIRSALASALSEAGHLVVEAADGEELLNLVIKDATSSSPRPFYDAIITDVVMPGFSGLDVLTAMRGRVARVPILVITAYGDARVRRLAQSLGAVTVLRKPFDFETLRKTLDAVLGGSTRPR